MIGKTNGKFILLAIRKYQIFILLCSILSSLFLTQLYVKVVVPKYYAVNQLLITPKAGEIIDLKYISTYKGLISSDVILTKVKNQLQKENISLSTDELQNLITLNISSKSQLISIQAVSSQKRKSIQIANAIGEITAKEIPKMMNQNNLSLITQTNQANKISQMSKKQFFFVSFIGSLLFYSILCIYRALFSKKIVIMSQTQDFVENSHIYILKKGKNI